MSGVAQRARSLQERASELTGQGTVAALTSILRENCVSKKEARKCKEQQRIWCKIFQRMKGFEEIVQN